jgi:aerobic carbon-monoxide dehydrogenase large subunit
MCFPYTTPMGVTYDVGDFARVLARAEELGDVAGFAARRAESEAKGRLRGLGLAFYIESILGEDAENAALEFREDGTAALYVGTQSNGQGHETVYARYLSDLTGIDEARIEIVQGDTDRIAKGGGTGGSRSVTVQSFATHAMAETMVAAFSEFLEETLDAGPFAFEDGSFRAPNSNRRPTLIEAAELARAQGPRRPLAPRDARETAGAVVSERRASLRGGDRPRDRRAAPRPLPGGG